MASASVEVWVLVDSSGDAVASVDPDVLCDLYEEQVGELGGAEGLRRVKVTLTVPLPEVVELCGVVPQDGQASLTVKGGA